MSVLSSFSIRLQVFVEDIMSTRLFSVLLDGYAGATNDLSGFAFLVEFAKAYPLSEFLVGVDLEAFTRYFTYFVSPFSCVAYHLIESVFFVIEISQIHSNKGLKRGYSRGRV